ncbi:MAG TPA: transglycosylase SLT domain-containing protein [Burkholderiales bacterium]|nr:transglycosylase SLT domain-containing protein [Burkholderiales bacterium]
MPVVVVAGALLIAAAPPSAVAPDVPPLAACTPAEAAALAAPGGAEPDVAQQALIDHVSRRFFVAATFTERMVATAYRAATEVGLDPLLVLAVIAVESRFNPIAESGMGAKGLMQIIPRFHMDKLRAAGGEDAVFDPESNILVGARILQEYVYRTGTLVAGLQQYNGASRDANAYYAQRVMAERERLEQVVRTRGLVTVAGTAQGS